MRGGYFLTGFFTRIFISYTRKGVSYVVLALILYLHWRFITIARVFGSNRFHTNQNNISSMHLWTGEISRTMGTKISHQILPRKISGDGNGHENSTLAPKYAVMNGNGLSEGIGENLFLTQEHVINPHPFKYIINNPNLCRNHGNLSYVVYVHSTPSAFERRQGLRDTWAQPDLLTGLPSQLVFFLGRPDDDVLKKVMEENHRHHDIIMVDYVDSYKNMTYKAISAFKWFTVYCPNVRYLIKADDDVYVDVAQVMSILQTKYQNHTRFFLCALFLENSLPILRNKSTCASWCAPDTFLPGEQWYPSFCSGSSYILSRDLTRDLYMASLSTPYFFIDDAFIGLLNRKIRPKASLYSFGFDRYLLDKYKLEDTIMQHQVFPSHLVVHNPSHRAEPIYKLFVENLYTMEKEHLRMISDFRWRHIKDTLYANNITLHIP